MNKEEIKIKEFDKEQLEILLNDLKDIDKFTGFKDGAFKYELGKYQACLLVNCIKKYKEVIDKIKKHCEIEINASNHYLENHRSQKELCHKVAHQRILDILKEAI